MSVSTRPHKINTIAFLRYCQPQKVRTVEELAAALCKPGGCRIEMDCGHHCTIGHNLANTMIIVSHGSGRISTRCHSCY